MNLQSSRVWLTVGHFVRLVGVVVLLAGFPMDELLGAHRFRRRALVLKRGAGPHRAHRPRIDRSDFFIWLLYAKYLPWRDLFMIAAQVGIFCLLILLFDFMVLRRLSFRGLLGSRRVRPGI